MEGECRQSTDGRTEDRTNAQQGSPRGGGGVGYIGCECGQPTERRNEDSKNANMGFHGDGGAGARAERGVELYDMGVDATDRPNDRPIDNRGFTKGTEYDKNPEEEILKTRQQRFPTCKGTGEWVG